MKIEKLTDDKIRIIINAEDLKENNIDSKSIMEKPIESQKLFLEMLLRAEKEVGFYTEGCKLLVEAFSSPDGIFVFTITKYIEKQKNPPKKIKVTPKKKQPELNIQSKISIYKFANFEEFCDLCICLNDFNQIKLKQLAKYISLYLYKNTYFLVLSEINIKNESIISFYSIISDFATLISHSEIFMIKLNEYGKILIKKNAIIKGIECFAKNKSI